MKLFSVSRFVMDSGERSCLIVDRVSRLPLYYPNLYVTTQIRNRSDASATMEAVASNLTVLLSFLERRGIDLENRLRTKQLFKVHEIDDLCDFAQRKLSRLPAKVPESLDGAFDLRDFEQGTDSVSNGTHYSRLTTIAAYISWLARHLLDEADPRLRKQIDFVSSRIKERRPKKRGRNQEGLAKSLNDDQVRELLEIVRLDSPRNPFKPGVQRRNRLMILLLYHLGIRGGELLNIRIRDLDFSKNELTIVRNADERDDVRVREPNAKTLVRTLPLRDTLVKELHDYIVHDRRKVPGSKRHDFLFITHKTGPSVGDPISKVAYFKILAVIRSTSPALIKLTGHMLRHTWNYRYSEAMDRSDDPASEVEQERVRSYVMGWKEGSGTASTYNRRFTEEKAHEASLTMQRNSGTRVPEGLENDEY